MIAQARNDLGVFFSPGKMGERLLAWLQASFIRRREHESVRRRMPNRNFCRYFPLRTPRPQHCICSRQHFLVCVCAWFCFPFAGPSDVVCFPASGVFLSTPAEPVCNSSVGEFGNAAEVYLGYAPDNHIVLPTAERTEFGCCFLHFFLSFLHLYLVVHGRTL